MGETTTRALGLGLAVAYAALIGWLYARQPQTIAQVTGGLSAVVGAYRVNDQAFADALRFFRNEQFVEARIAFERADPAVRDARPSSTLPTATTVRGGDGCITTIACTPKASTRSTARWRSRRTDASSWTIPTSRCTPAEEVKAEFEAGLRRDASDLNPMRVFGTRK